MKNLSRKEAAKVLEDMKVKIEIQKAVVTQWKRNTALDMAIGALKYSEVPNSSDCISRQAAIDALSTPHGILYPIRTVEALPSAQQEQRWIPVMERLPEEDGLYLVTTSKGQTQVHVFSHNGNSEKYWMRCNKAWMPLPEPWKGDAE